MEDREKRMQNRFREWRTEKRGWKENQSMEDREKRMKREYQSMEDIRRKQEANNKKFRLIKKLAEN